MPLVAGRVESLPPPDPEAGVKMLAARTLHPGTFVPSAKGAGCKNKVA